MADRQAEIDEHAAAVMKMLEADGEIEKIQSLIGRLVSDSNWRDEVRKLGARRMDTDQIEELTPESVTEMIMGDAIEALPNSVEAAVVRYIRDFLTKKKVPAEPPKPINK
jgi:hypothetical protein